MTEHSAAASEVRVNIAFLNLSFADLAITSASTDVVRGFGGDLVELEEWVREGFADGASWCRIGNEAHTVSEGDAELRLVPRSDTPDWHLNYFHAGWESEEGKQIPPQYRLQYARYVDRRHEVREGCLTGKDLRVVAAKDGAEGVDLLVRHHRAQLTEWYKALDALLSSVESTPDLPGWAKAVAKEELLNWHRTREYMTSAVMEYHHGDAGLRPETVWGNLRFDFSATSVDLVP
ncbi:hypothetical protein ACWD7B_09780 [Streptomyces rubiginosohelvolus]